MCMCLSKSVSDVIYLSTYVCMYDVQCTYELMYVDMFTQISLSLCVTLVNMTAIFM